MRRHQVTILAAVAASVLGGALACGQVEQELGDSGAGAGGSDVTLPVPTSGAVSSGSDSSGGSGQKSPPLDWPQRQRCFEDGGTCPERYGCFLPWESDGNGPIYPGVCAPVCDYANASAVGEACAPDADGRLGICRLFLTNPNVVGSYVPICSRDCDPLAPTCPDRYSCEATNAGQGEFVFACLPVVKRQPLLEGESCDGLPMGQCAAGLSCVKRGGPATCSKYCDLSSVDACPSSQLCVRPRDFPEGSVGICGSRD